MRGRSIIALSQERCQFTSTLISHLTLFQWLVLGFGAAMVGISKTGIAGLGIVAVAIFAVALPAKVSVGVVLPILICGDVVAVSTYRRNAVWSHLIKLAPWAAVGVILGYFALGRVNNHQVSVMIGAILLALVALQMIRRKGGTGSDQDLHKHPLVSVLTGILAGFTTMVANAAGPIMVLYLLATGLPKLEFIGTGAWFFFSLNLFKVPFSIGRGMINPHSFMLDLCLVPLCILGGYVGRKILRHIQQEQFEMVAIVLTVCAALKLLFQG